jgi:hypothetical protein
VSETEKPLTAEMVRHYVNAKGTHCPYCQSPDIEAGKVEADGASAWSHVTCNECGREWQDVFFLGAVDIIDANGIYGDTIMPAPEDPDGSAKSAVATPSAT